MIRSYIFTISLAVFALTLDSGVCNRLLMLDDNEMEQRNLTRTYTVAKDYFSKNKEAVLTLNEGGFFRSPVESFEGDEGTQKALRVMAQEKSSYLARDYGQNTKDLLEDLEEIREVLISNKGISFGLDTKEKVTLLRKYISALLRITSYFDYLKKQNSAS